jgi:predicted permease
LGRSFNASEEDAGIRAAILSYGLWKSTLGGDPALVGGIIRLDHEPYVVVGIAPEGFNFPLDGPPVQIWTPLAIDARSATVQPITRQRGARILSLIGRLKPGLSIEQAQTDLDRVAASLASRFPGENRATPLAYVDPHRTELTDSIRRPLWILLGAVSLVLLVACANMANLILSRTAGRAHEFAIRAAIGAGRARIFRQVLTESLALSLLGSAVGVLAAHFTLQLLEPLAGAIPRIEQSSIDQRVLLFSLLLAIGISMGFSFAPALRVGRCDYVDPLKQGARGIVAGTDRLRSALVVCQIALGLVLVSAAGLLASSFLRMMNRDPGFQSERLLTFSVHLPGSLYPPPRQLAFYSQLIENLNGTRGIASAAISMPLPLSGSQMWVSFNIEQSPSPPYARPSSDMAIVSSGFFQSVSIPLVRGRHFLPTDDAGAPAVLIVNKAFADKFFPGQDPVGKRIEPGATSGPGGSRMREIVGVVGNARQSPLNPAPQPIYYFPYQQLPWCCPSVIVRADGSPANLEPTVRAAVASLDRMLPVSDVRTPAEILSLGTTPPALSHVADELLRRARPHPDCRRPLWLASLRRHPTYPGDQRANCPRR